LCIIAILLAAVAPGAPQAAATESHLGRRVRRILDGRTGRMTAGLALASLAALALIGCLGLPTAAERKAAKKQGEFAMADKTQDRTMQQLAARVKREGDRVWIEGVKGWSIPEMPSSVHGAQTTVMNTIGEKVDYEELVGASGLAFRLQVSKEGICPSSPHAYCG